MKIDTLFDSRSQTNLISVDLVKKMNLETVPHHKSYTSGWITKDANLQATQSVFSGLKSPLISLMKLN